MDLKEITMNQEDKELLLKDLCARLPYGVKINSAPIKGYSEGFIGELAFCSIKREQLGLLTEYGELVVNLSCDIVRPYLRPMSSMTEEERNEWASGYAKLTLDIFKKKVSDEMDIPDASDSAFSIDWLNAHHFDYRGLLEKGLALEAPERMYNLNK